MKYLYWSFEPARLGAIAVMVLACSCGGTQANHTGTTPAQVRGSEQAPDAPEASEGVAARPPDFELEALNGDFVRLSDHLGKQVVLIDFWATFCHPCLTSMPHLEELYQKYRDQGFLV